MQPPPRPIDRSLKCILHQVNSICFFEFVRSPSSDRQSQVRSHRNQERSRLRSVTQSRSDVRSDATLRGRKRERSETPTHRRHSRGSFTPQQGSKRHRRSVSVKSRPAQHERDGRHGDRRGSERRHEHRDSSSASRLLPKHRRLRRLLRSSVIDTTNENLLAENRDLKKVILKIRYLFKLVKKSMRWFQN